MGAPFPFGRGVRQSVTRLRARDSRRHTGKLRQWPVFDSDPAKVGMWFSLLDGAICFPPS